MNITSLLFIALAFVSALVYHRLPVRYRNLWLLILSAGFLATWSWQFILVLLTFGLINFGFGFRIEKTIAKKKAWLVFGILLNLIILFIFKYNDFYQSAGIRLLQGMGINAASDGLKILLPVGLSFLVVQAISYLIDVSNGLLKAESNLIKFWVYVLYFPKLLSGPVERAREFLPRLDNPLPLDKTLIERSLVLIVTGLFRKLFFADSLFRMIPESAFLIPQDHTGQNLVFWLLGYAFALYNDFAGYTSIVRGISLWFGIELNNNFNLPYLSHNFTEFWNRWHISLSSWLRDTIYYPFSWTLTRRFPGRGNLVALAIPPLATMLVSGLWHGLSWNLLVWGSLHGLFLLGERLFVLIKRPLPLSKQSRGQRALGIVTTFTLAVLAWIPFRMSLPVAWEFFTGMFKWVMPSRSLLLAYLKGSTAVLSWSPLNLPNPLLILLIAMAIGFDCLMNRAGNEIDLRTFPTGRQIVLLVVIILLILASLFTDSVAPFVYQGF